MNYFISHTQEICKVTRGQMMTRGHIFYSEAFHTVLIVNAQDIGYHLSEETNISLTLVTELAFPISALVRTGKTDT